MEELKLGQEVRDKITGFKGIAIARTVYLQACSRILVQPKVNEEGKIPECQSFDEPDLEVIGNGILPKPKPKKNGGPHPTASRALEPSRKLY